MKIEDLRLKIGSIDLAHPVMNAGGTCKTIEELKQFILTEIAAVEVGSITLHPRPGNPGNVYYCIGDCSLNSNGLPNRGWNYYKEQLSEMIRLAHDAGKPLFVNIAGIKLAEYQILLNNLREFPGIDLVILNCGCPNIWQDGKPKEILSYSPGKMRQLLEIAGGSNIRLGIKLSPFLEAQMELMEQVSEIIFESPVKIIITSNTLPNQRIDDGQGKPVLDKMVYGGMGGPALKPIALEQVRKWRKLLPQTINIIGVGGITSGQDVCNFLQAGASAVQIATAYFGQTHPQLQAHKPQVFGDVLFEYAEIMGVE